MGQEMTEGKIKYIYKTPEDLKQYFVNGVYGGRTPQGDVLCTFYFEHSILPQEDEIVFRDGKPMLSELDLSSITLQRDFKVGIIMSPNQAKNIGEWMIKLGEGNTKPAEPNTDE